MPKGEYVHTPGETASVTLPRSARGVYQRDVKELREDWSWLSVEERIDFHRRATTISGKVWIPFPGPQLEALYSPADELFYGGAAGGG
jgi:hypothetical protein